MFPNLVPLFANDDALAELAGAMLDKLDAAGTPDPAGAITISRPAIPATTAPSRAIVAGGGLLVID